MSPPTRKLAVELKVRTNGVLRGCFACDEIPTDRALSPRSIIEDSIGKPQRELWRVGDDGKHEQEIPGRGRCHKSGSCVISGSDGPGRLSQRENRTGSNQIGRTRRRTCRAAWRRRRGGVPLLPRQAESFSGSAGFRPAGGSEV